MSTYIYLVCANHDPKLWSTVESGQHTYDLPQIRSDIRNKEILIKAIEAAEWTVDRGHHFLNATAHFLAEHPKCKIEIRSSYGDEWDIDSESLEPIGKNLPKSMVPKGAIILVTADNHEWAAETSGRSLDFVRGAWDSANEQGVVCTIKVI